MSQVTINDSDEQPREGRQLSKEDSDLIAEFIRTKGVTICPPVSATGNEVSNGTYARVVEARKQFRANQRAKKQKN